VQGYQILFPILTFVSQRQSLVEKKFSPLEFPLISADFISTLSIIWFFLYMILSSIYKNYNQINKVYVVDDR
jgi:hypothetical protein